MEEELERIAELAIEESRLSRKCRVAMLESAEAQRKDPTAPEAHAAFERWSAAISKANAALDALRKACYRYDGVIGAARNSG